MEWNYNKGLVICCSVIAGPPSASERCSAPPTSSTKSSWGAPTRGKPATAWKSSSTSSPTESTPASPSTDTHRNVLAFRKYLQNYYYVLDKCKGVIGTTVSLPTS